MNCQLCNKVIETYDEWLLGECPSEDWFGHKLTGAEEAAIKQQRPPNTTPTTITKWFYPQ